MKRMNFYGESGFSGLFEGLFEGLPSTRILEWSGRRCYVCGGTIVNQEMDVRQATFLLVIALGVIITLFHFVERAGVCALVGGIPSP